MLNYDSDEEFGTSNGNKTGRRVVSEEDFMLNARILINKTYYRHNMYALLLILPPCFRFYPAKCVFL